MSKKAVLLVVFYSIAGLLAAQQQPRGTQSTIVANSFSGTTYGLVVGVSRYQNHPALAYADADAVAMQIYLQSLQKKGEPAENISLFTNEQATRDAIADRLYFIDEKLKKGDRVVVYFGGHGDMEHIDQSQNCLLLLGNSPKKNYLRVSNSYVDIDLFNKFFPAWAERQVNVIFICDACHSGSLSGGETGRSNTLLSLQQAWKNEVKMLSCQANELSLEGPQWGGGRGLFSYFLVRGLQGMADRNKDQNVSIFELKRFVEDSVGQYSDNSQTPQVSGGNVNAPLVAYTEASLRAAKANNHIGQGDLALKGGEEDRLILLLKDSAQVARFRSWTEHMRLGEWLSPAGNCAKSDFEFISASSAPVAVKTHMKLRLMKELQQGFDEMIEFVYNDRLETFDFGKRYEIERNIAACQQLAGANSYLFNKIRARALFLSATGMAAGIQRGVPITGRIAEMLESGIDSLKKAIRLDPMAPYLYLKLGDYLLFTSSHKEAIDAYQSYRNLLPKDEYAVNKLGLAWFEAGDRARAVACFKEALSINPGFDKARQNLEAMRR